MKKYLYFIIVFFAFKLSFSQQTKVLFIGNSFTASYYSVPAAFNAFATTAGISVSVDYSSPGGYQIVNHIAYAPTQTKITSKKWDYVVVQDNLGNLANNVGSISSTTTNAHYTLVNQIRANDSCTRIVFFAGWGPEGGLNSSDNTNNCINRIHENYIILNNNVADEIVSPIGKSWIASLAQLPSVDLYHSDNVHASSAGAYLTAATIFTTIFKKDLTNINYNSTLSPSDAQTMRTIAYNQVTNATYLNTTNLSSFTPTISVSGPTMTCVQTYPTYQWYLNNSPVSGANGKSHVAYTVGNYYVKVTDSSGCTHKSFEVNMTTTSLNQNNISNELKLISNGNNSYELLGEEIGAVKIFDIQGKIVYEENKTNNLLSFDLNKYAKGLYVLSFVNEKNFWTKKIILK